MAEGWVRGRQGLGYGWVVVRVCWVYGVGQEGRDEGRVGRGWDMVGLGYVWVRVRVEWGVWGGARG